MRGRALVLPGVAVACLLAGCHFGSSAEKPSGGLTSPAATPTSTPTPTKTKSVFDQVSSGVVRIMALDCNASGAGYATSGSGLLVAPDLVLTVAHVVNDSTNLAMRAGSSAVGGVVVGMSPKKEVALIRLDKPLEGHVFTLAADPASVGDPDSMLGYPLGQDLTVTTGTVSGLGRRIQLHPEKQNLQFNSEGRQILVPSLDLRGLIQTDAPISPGNSGGPMIDKTGAVIGLAEASSTATGAENLNYAVPAPTAAALLAQWKSNTDKVRTAPCSDPGHVWQGVAVKTSAVDAPEIAALFDTYFFDLNTGQPRLVYTNLFTGAYQQRLNSEQKWEDSLSTSVYSSPNITRVSVTGPDSDSADLTYTTTQSAKDAPKSVPRATCVVWHLRYRLNLNEWWLLDGKVTQTEPVRRCTSAESSAADQGPSFALGGFGD